MSLALLAAALGADPCPEGMERADPGQSTCCWPAQVWSGTTCTGIPKCPDGMRTTPTTCTTEPAKPRPKPVERRLVLFSGFSGHTLFVDGREVGRLPTSLDARLGEHDWAVQDSDGTEVATGRFKARRGDDNQLVMLKKPAPAP